MKTEFKAIDVGTADCLFLLLTADDSSEYNIMIDCGESNTEDVEKYVAERLHNHIHLLIVTHIDDDHIGGLRTLLPRHQHGDARWTIDCIWYNCNQYQQKVYIYPSVRKIRTKNNAFNAEGRRLTSHRGVVHFYSSGPSLIDDNELRELWKKDDNCAIRKRTTSLRGPAHSYSLAKILYDDDEWRNAWERMDIRINNLNAANDPPHCIQPANWDEKFGHFTLLSPSEDRLFELSKHYKRYLQGKVNTRDLCQVREANETGIEAISSFINESANDSLSKDGSDANGASIAFEWEGVVDGISRRYLLLGDAWHSEVINGLRQIGVSTNRFYDLIKIAHHGSSANTNEELMSIIDGTHFWITGYTATTYYSCPALARIIKRPLWVGYEYPNSLREIHLVARTKASEMLETHADQVRVSHCCNIVVEGEIKYPEPINSKNRKDKLK